VCLIGACAGDWALTGPQGWTHNQRLGLHVRALYALLCRLCAPLYSCSMLLNDSSCVTQVGAPGWLRGVHAQQDRGVLGCSASLSGLLVRLCCFCLLYLPLLLQHCCCLGIVCAQISCFSARISSRPLFRPAFAQLHAHITPSSMLCWALLQIQLVLAPAVCE
jgi:hypothetical protein